jgi:hypothetical protein
MSGPIGYVDTPAAEAVAGTAIRITGWALDTQQIDRVEVRVGSQIHVARYGLPRPDVAAVNPGYPDADDCGFVFEADLAPLRPERHRVAVVAVSRGGSESLLASKSLIPIEARKSWQALYAMRVGSDRPPFYILPALSGVSLGGAAGLADAYAPYLSPTVCTGMRVPILYLRTTHGAERDWTFDPDWDVDRCANGRRIAEDSLSSVIAHSIRHRLPVLFTLNGGVWADAAGSAPEWDVNDHLEEDEANCQWNEHDQVMPEDFLARAPGTHGAQIGRSLTFNIYAERNRHYKKRNMQAASSVIAAFARAHPRLFVGVILDPDTYLNPFYDFGEHRQWYDYNPGTLRQFRQWLAGSGPYEGRPSPGAPDLSRYRRKPLSLTEVCTLAGASFASWDEVEPPRSFPIEGRPFWDDPWTREWEVFRRHLVQLHYSELSQWAAETGIPMNKIHSAQGFRVRIPPVAPFAVHIDSPIRGYDAGGMSIEGAIPSHGHLGAIVYGAGALNEVPMEAGSENLFATFHRMDPQWAVAEFNTADFQTPGALPGYAMAYRALREMYNYGARFISPMAWNGCDGRDCAHPDYISYTAWRNTALEEAMRDFALSHAFLPLGARLWTFGSPRHADSDGWMTANTARLAAGNGYLDLACASDSAMLFSPSPLALAREETDLLVLGVTSDALESLSVEARTGSGGWMSIASPRAACECERTSAGISVPLVWPAALECAEQLRISLTPATKDAIRIAHIALYPRAAQA